jgi:hypothetical protein
MSAPLVALLGKLGIQAEVVARVTTTDSIQRSDSTDRIGEA